MFFFLALACEMPAPPKPPAKPAKPPCELDLAKLGGTAWLYDKPQPSGPNVPDPTARMRFVDEAGVTKANYTAGSISDMFSYGCTLNDTGKILTCLESDGHVDAFCHASAAVHDGVCDPAEVAAATGLALDVATTSAVAVNKELKKLKGPEIAQQRKVDNNPNNKLRSKFLVAIDRAKCVITVQDKYQTMVDGKLNEFENQIGTAKFVKADADYTWSPCKDVESAGAPGPDGVHLPTQPAGAIKFSAWMQKSQKGAAGCTYSADVYKDWVKVQGELHTVDDKKYGPRWDATVALSAPGRHVVYFDRYKTCDGKREPVGVACAMVRITD